jgi:hypothetical protein
MAPCLVIPEAPFLFQPLPFTLSFQLAYDRNSHTFFVELALPALDSVVSNPAFSRFLRLSQLDMAAPTFVDAKAWNDAG